MTDIDEIKIRRLDLTILLVFLHMMRDGNPSTSRAGWGSRNHRSATG